MRRRQEPRQVQGSHTDDWLITYADTITLLLCLFVMLLASQARNLELAQNLIHATPVEQPAVVPVNHLDWKPSFAPMIPGSEIPGDNAYTDADDNRTPLRQAVPVAPIADAPGLPGEQRPPAGPPNLVATVPELVPPPQPANDVPRMWLPEIVANPDADRPAHMEPEGDRITTLAFDSAAFFNRGSATLSSSGKVILQQLVGDLKSKEYLDYTATIEGHTDDVPISNAQFPSNWELSSARAAAVVRFFIEQGVSAQRLRAAGYADTHPLRPNRDSNGIALPENQAKNRRVVIGLEKIERH
jgi:chemotaxis protein MotB